MYFTRSRTLSCPSVGLDKKVFRLVHSPDPAVTEENGQSPAVAVLPRRFPGALPRDVNLLAGRNPDNAGGLFSVKPHEPVRIPFMTTLRGRPGQMDGAPCQTCVRRRMRKPSAYAPFPCSHFQKRLWSETL